MMYLDEYTTSTTGTLSQFVEFATGSYMTPDMGSCYWVLIECGSLTATNLAINGCTVNQIATGSYIVMGPTDIGLGSSRAQLYKTLFYGTGGTDARIMNNYVGNITGLKVCSNTYDDVGKRFYYFTATASSTETDTVTLAFQNQTTNGSVCSWSYVSADSWDTGDTATATWQMPTGTTLTTATQSNNTAGAVTVNEIVINTDADIKTNPASAYLYAYCHNVGYAAASAAVIVGTIGSVGSTLVGVTTTLDFTSTHNVPLMGSVDTNLNLTGSISFIQRPVYLINSGKKNFVMQTCGSYANTTTTSGSTSWDNGQSWIIGSESKLTKITGTAPLGSLVLKTNISRTNTKTKDIFGGVGVMYFG